MLSFECVDHEKKLSLANDAIRYFTEEVLKKCSGDELLASDFINGTLESHDSYIDSLRDRIKMVSDYATKLRGQNGA